MSTSDSCRPVSGWAMKLWAYLSCASKVYVKSSEATALRRPSESETLAVSCTSFDSLLSRTGHRLDRERTLLARYLRLPNRHKLVSQFPNRTMATIRFPHRRYSPLYSHRISISLCYIQFAKLRPWYVLFGTTLEGPRRIARRTLSIALWALCKRSMNN